MLELSHLLRRIAGPVLALLAGVVGLSAVQAHFALETKPIWDVGVLRYGYKNPGINQVLPDSFRSQATSMHQHAT